MVVRRRVSFRRVAVFGTGRAGCALLRSLAQAGGTIEVVVVGNRSPVAFAPAGARATRGVARTLDAAVDARADILFVAVSDGAIGRVASQIDKRPTLPPVVAHLSGAQGRETLLAIADRTETAAFHPLAALHPDRPIPEGTVVGISAATARRFQRLAALATQLGLRGERVRQGTHAGYHLGASLAANLPVALLAESAAKLRGAGLDEEAALTAAVGLMRSAVDNAQALANRGEHDLGQVLTGPIARGDLMTVQRHLGALSTTERGGELGQAYRSLSVLLTRLAKLDEARRTALLALLDDEADEALLN